MVTMESTRHGDTGKLTLRLHIMLLGEYWRANLFRIWLQERNERLFFRVLVEHFEELKPVMSDATVREACR